MPGLAEAFERTGAFLEHRLTLAHAAGAALSVTDGDELLGVVVRGFADHASGTPVRPETRFQIGSIGKSFAAIVALQEAEAGRLDLHAPVTGLLPWAEIPQPFGPITPHHLITHTSGLIAGTEDAPGEMAAVWNLRGCEPGFPPGERFWYSNDAYKLLGLILERAAGQPFPALVRERVLEPLGMALSEAAITNETRLDIATGYATAYDDRPPQRYHPLVPATWIVSDSADGSIVSNVLDMAAYVRMLLHRGEPLLSPESFRTLTTPVIEDPDMQGFSYAYGLWVGERDGRREIYHSGGMVGYTALMIVRPDEGLGGLMLLNGSGDRKETLRYALDAAGAALRGEPLPEIEHPGRAPTPNVTDYEGVFRGDGREVRLTAEGEYLVLREGDVEVALEPNGDHADELLVPHPALDRYRVVFGRDSSGRVVELFHGPHWLRNEAYAGPEPEPAPVEWEGFAGFYRSNDPWLPCFRIVLRKGELRMLSAAYDHGDVPLVPLPDGSLRVGGQEWRPDRIRFDRVLDGRATRAVLDGGSWYRSFED